MADELKPNKMMLDIMIMQLRSAMDIPGLPEYVKGSGDKFISDLEKWSKEGK
jgi:hypothetical protein